MEPSSETLRKEIDHLNNHEITNRIKMYENNMRIARSEKSQISHQIYQLESQVSDNKKKLQNNKRLPYLVSNIVEMLDNNDPETREDHEYHVTTIIKTSTRQTVIIMLGIEFLNILWSFWRKVYQKYIQYSNQ